ncbi:hypothetical protein MHYP_G00094450 [Metynnis hypsauchen]
MSGKDLVQEVMRLQHSLNDAEDLSLETKKERAFLWTDNPSLKEMPSSLSDVLDNLMLEKTVAKLKKELEKSQEKEGALQSEMEMKPAKVGDLLRWMLVLKEVKSLRNERTVLRKDLQKAAEMLSQLSEDLLSLKILQLCVEIEFERLKRPTSVRKPQRHFLKRDTPVDSRARMSHWHQRLMQTSSRRSSMGSEKNVTNSGENWRKNGRDELFQDIVVEGEQSHSKAGSQSKSGIS